MGIQRFDDPEEARRALWAEPGDPELGNRIRAVWAFARRLAPGAPPRGLRRFRCIEDAARAREEETAARVARLRAERGDGDA